ncbi:hypothetical protein MTO96_003084 [Rhipicephalus appendiculatus]
MLAYAKYDDGYRAVLPDRLIKGFAPSDVDDFLKHRKVHAHWRSEDGATEGFYAAAVHALAETMQEMNMKIKKMSEPFPRLIEVALEQEPRKKRKEPTHKEAKRQKIAAQEALHKKILEEHKENEPLSDDETESLKQKFRELRRNEEKKDAEIKRLKRNVRAAEEKIARLTDALLDKIEIARSEERPGPSGSIAAVAVPHHLASDAANADNFVEASFVDMVVDTSAENVSEFILDSSVDEVLGLPKEMIYAEPEEHGI